MSAVADDQQQPTPPTSGTGLSVVLDRLAAFPILAYEPGDVVLHESSSTNRLLFLRSGVVDVVKDDVLIAQVNEPGAVFGDMAFILGRPHTANVLAASPCSLLVVDDAAALLDADPYVARHLMVTLADRLEAVNRLLIEAWSPGERSGALDGILSKISRALIVSGRNR